MQNDTGILNKLNEYNHKANENLLNHLKSVSPLNERIFILMSHVVNAQQIWLARILEDGVTSGVFDLRDSEELARQNKINFDKTNTIFNSIALDKPIYYNNTKNQKFQNSVTDIFLHFFNHATYHRGQINQLLTAEGKMPLVMDYIAYHREEII